jgi:hypothetical protein
LQILNVRIRHDHRGLNLEEGRTGERLDDQRQKKPREQNNAEGGERSGLIESFREHSGLTSTDHR